MSSEADIVSLRVTLRYKDLDEFALRYAENISSAGLFLRTKAPKPAGTKIRFELLLTDGARALRGEGVVVTVRDGDKPGMAIRFNSLDAESHALVDRVVATYGEGQLAPTPLSTRFGKQSIALEAPPRTRSTAAPWTARPAPAGWNTAPKGSGGALPRKALRSFQEPPAPSSSSPDKSDAPLPPPPPSSGTRDADPAALPRKRSAVLRPWAKEGSALPTTEEIKDKIRAKEPSRDAFDRLHSDRNLPDRPSSTTQTARTPADRTPTELGIAEGAPARAPVDRSSNSESPEGGLRAPPRRDTVLDEEPAAVDSEQRLEEAREASTPSEDLEAIRQAAERSTTLLDSPPHESTDEIGLEDPPTLGGARLEAEASQLERSPTILDPPEVEPSTDSELVGDATLDTAARVPVLSLAEDDAPNQDGEDNPAGAPLSAAELMAYGADSPEPREPDAHRLEDAQQGEGDPLRSAEARRAEEQSRREEEARLTNEAKLAEQARRAREDALADERRREEESERQEAKRREEEAERLEAIRREEEAERLEAIRREEEAERLEAIRREEEASSPEQAVRASDEETERDASRRHAELPSSDDDRALIAEVIAAEASKATWGSAFDVAGLPGDKTPPVDIEAGLDTPLEPSIISERPVPAIEVTQSTHDPADTPDAPLRVSSGEDDLGRPAPADVSDSESRSPSAVRGGAPPPPPRSAEASSGRDQPRSRGSSAPSADRGISVTGVSPSQTSKSEGDVVPSARPPPRLGPMRPVIERDTTGSLPMMADPANMGSLRDSADARPNVRGTSDIPVRPLREEQTSEAPPPKAKSNGTPITVGIDFGGRWIRMSTERNGTHELIPVGTSPFVPALVAARSDGSLAVGSRARTIFLDDPWRAVAPRAVLRLLTNGTIDPVGRPANIRLEGGRVVVDLGTRSVEFEEILTALFGHLREAAATHFHESKIHAAISIPNDLDPGALALLRRACQSAGFDELKLIPEPEALIRAYRLDEQPVDSVLMVDVGATHLGLVVAKREATGFSVVGSRWIDELSAGELDDRVVDLAIEELKSQKDDAHAKDPAARTKLLEAAERARVDIRRNVTVELKVALLASGASNVGIERSIKLPRARIYEVTEESVRRICGRVQELLRDTGIQPRSIGATVVAGSAGFYPPLMQALSALTSKEPLTSMPTTQVFAVGLARPESQAPSERPPPAGGAAATLSSSIGIALPGGRFRPLIKRGENLPTQLRRTHATTREDQSEVEIELWECDSDLLRDGTRLGTVTLTDVPKKPRGAVQIEMLIEVDRDEVVTVTLSEPTSNGRTQQAFATKMTPAERRAALTEQQAAAPQPDPRSASKKGGLLSRLLGRS